MSTEYQNQGQEGDKDHRYRKTFPDDPKKTPAATPENQAWRVNGAFVVSTHVVAILALVFYRPKFLTIIFSLVLWQGACLGITMGYHRLWAHRSYAATFPLRIFLAILGTLGFQGSIKWWVQRHRLHHRFTDTDNDPYNALRGFWFSHIGWIFEKPFYPRLRSIDVSDLLSDPIVVFQHKYYVPLALIFGIVLPTLIAGAWHDMFGGFLYAGYVVRLLIWHATFCINSFAHWMGDQDFSTNVSARGNILLALLTVGEGYHNFHHEFPKDFRNGIRFTDYDPTKWGIQLASYLGLAHNLHRTSAEDIHKAMVETSEKKIREARQTLDWGPADVDLPSWTLDEVNQLVREKEACLVIVENYVLDVTEYIPTHPGGAKVLKAHNGKDATLAFNGGMNMHTQAARTKSRMLRVAKLRPESKREAPEKSEKNNVEENSLDFL